MREDIKKELNRRGIYFEETSVEKNGVTKDELEYLIECVKEKEDKNGYFNSNS